MVPNIESQPRYSKRAYQPELPVRWIRKRRAVECRASDVSRDGMFLCTTEEVPAGTTLELDLTLPGRCRLHMSVIAVFVGVAAGGPGIYVEILVMDQIERMAWDEYFGLPRPAQNDGIQLIGE